MATFQFDVVGIGLNSVDLLCRVKEFPVFNTKSSLDDVSRQGGGQAATAMAALSRLEMKTAFIGVVGDDDDGFFSILPQGGWSKCRGNGRSARSRHPICRHRCSIRW